LGTSTRLFERKREQAFPALGMRLPETPPRATPFDKLRTGLGGLIPAYDCDASRKIQKPYIFLRDKNL